MESRDYTGGFENFLQEKTDQYKLYPSDRVWNAINAKLHPRKKWSYLFVAAIFLGLGIGGKVHDSSFLKGFEQATDVEAISNTELAKLSPVIPINRATSSKKASRTASQNLSKGTEPFGTLSLSQPSGSSSLSQPSGQPLLMETMAGEVSPLTQAESIQTSTEHNSGVHRTEDLVSVIINSDGRQVTEEMAVEQNPASVIQKQGAHAVDEHNTPDEHSFVELQMGDQRINAFATIPQNSSTYTAKAITATHLNAPEKASAIKVLKKRNVNLGWQLYLSPTVSYRKLSGEGMKLYATTFNVASVSPDVNSSVIHKPSIGFEIGTALTINTSRNFRFKTGVQLNVNQYDVQAYSFTPEVAPLTRGGIGHTEINVISRFRNYDGFSKTWLTNKHIMMSLPVGAELTVFGNNKIKFNIAGTLQPTFVLNNQAYMISTNMKNYAQEPSLYKKFNMAAGAEAYISIKAGSYRWMLGPQFRYQVFSSYKKEYPITEHLMDYGFKIGISR